MGIWNWLKSRSNVRTADDLLSTGGSGRKRKASKTQRGARRKTAKKATRRARGW